MPLSPFSVLSRKIYNFPSAFSSTSSSSLPYIRHHTLPNYKINIFMNNKWKDKKFSIAGHSYGIIFWWNFNNSGDASLAISIFLNHLDSMMILKLLSRKIDALPSCVLSHFGTRVVIMTDFFVSKRGNWFYVKLFLGQEQLLFLFYRQFILQSI